MRQDERLQILVDFQDNELLLFVLLFAPLIILIIVTYPPGKYDLPDDLPDETADIIPVVSEFFIKNLLNEMLLIQTLLIITSLYFISTFNVITIWYLAGIYLVFLGWWLMLDDGDIFVGFLWVIDLGVGLIFFIFILHYSTFLHQKSNVDKTSREFSFTLLSYFLFGSVFFFINNPSTSLHIPTLTKTWVFLVSWYDYYDFFFSPTVTDLNLLHELYFTSNSFEFFLINFFLLYGIIASILATFLIKRIFNFMNYSQLVDQQLLTQARFTYFIRNQDYLKQQSTSAGTRVWIKKKQPKL